MHSRQLQELLDLLVRFGVEIRETPMGGSGGGLCTIRGGRVFFLDVSADEATQMERALEAVAESPEAEQVYLPPAVRERLPRRDEQTGEEERRERQGGAHDGA